MMSSADGMDVFWCATFAADAPWGRILQCSNGHLLCSEAGPEGGESCSSQLRSSRQNNNCPVCRQTLPDDEIRALSAEQSIAALPAKCVYCSVDMTRGDMKRHVLACPLAPARCVAEGCRWTGLQEKRAAHEGTCVWGRGLLGFRCGDKGFGVKDLGFGV